MVVFLLWELFKPVIDPMVRFRVIEMFDTDFKLLFLTPKTSGQSLEFLYFLQLPIIQVRLTFRVLFYNDVWVS